MSAEYISPHTKISDVPAGDGVIQRSPHSKPHLRCRLANGHFALRSFRTVSACCIIELWAHLGNRHMRPTFVFAVVWWALTGTAEA